MGADPPDWGCGGVLRDPPHVQTQHPHLSSSARELEARSPPTPSAQSPLLAPGVMEGLPCRKDSVQLHRQQTTKLKSSQAKARAAAHMGDWIDLNKANARWGETLRIL